MASNSQETTALAVKFRSLADKYVENGDAGKAFESYLSALTVKPEWKDELETVFSSALCDWGKILEHYESYDHLFKVYERALNFYPNNAIILNNLGAHLCRLQHPVTAMMYFQRALNLNNDYLPAYNNLQNIKSLLVERWHFRMLNDTIRNRSYQTAICKTIMDGHKTVLDIGSGTGILSIFAKRGGADKVYGCDYSETMISISSQVIAANSLSDSIKLINKLSNQLTIPADIPERVSLVVTETFDAGLLGEHILETLIHALENLLCLDTKTNEGVVASVIPEGAAIYIMPIECLSIARKNYIIKGNRCERQSFNLGLNLSDVNICSRLEEPYDTENLKCVPYTSLAHPLKLFNFQFNNLLELKKYYDGDITRTINIEIIKDGYIDAFAVWFDLFLDNEIVITSSPLQMKSCCWEQAVFPLNREQYVSKHSIISVFSCCAKGVLSIRFENNPSYDTKQEYISTLPTILSLLNCESLLQSLAKALDIANGLLKGKVHILEVSCFPYIALLFTQNRSSEVFFSHPNPEVVHEVATLLDSFYSNMKITLLSWAQALELSENADNKFHIIYTDILASNGQFNEEIICGLPYLRSLLKSEGLFFPPKITMYGKYVYSEELSNLSKLNPTNDELKISEFINEFKLDQMIDISIHGTVYEDMSNTFVITSLNVLDWNIEFNHFEKVEHVIKPGFVNALLYWFCYNFLDDIHFNTLSEDSYINHAAVMLHSPIQVDISSKLKVSLELHRAIMRFHVALA